MQTNTRRPLGFSARFTAQLLFLDDVGRCFYYLAPSLGLMLSLQLGGWIEQPLPDTRRLMHAPAETADLLRDSCERALRRREQ